MVSPVEFWAIELDQKRGRTEVPGKFSRIMEVDHHR